MKLVLQRVQQASVTVDGQTVASIPKGMLILCGVAKGDTRHDLTFLARKASQLRIFNDEQGKMNLDIQAVQGEFLVVSQFTLYADCSKGNRPGYHEAAPPEEGERMYLELVKALKNLGHSVQTGSFGAKMQVMLINDGPVTIEMESRGRTRP